jgi:hypothetical protein
MPLLALVVWVAAYHSLKGLLLTQRILVMDRGRAVLIIRED